MTKILLAGVAMLSVLSASAAHSVTLPDTLIGTWCYSEGDNPDPPILGGPLIYIGHNRKKCQYAVDQMGIRQDGVDGHEDTCIFERIEQIRANAYLIYYRCEDGNGDADGGGPATFELLDGKLVITPLPEG